MATVVFDFDSTLITLESLEEILAPKIAAQPGLIDRISEITNLGMEGKLSFSESLERRLALAAPTREDVTSFGERAVKLLTPGMETLIKGLSARGISVRVVSGGLREAIVPTALYLGLDADSVHAVSLLWDDDGAFAGIDPDDLFSQSKIAGVTPLLDEWSAPRIVVGDGMTDYHLFRDGLADHFFAFTGNIEREAVVATGEPVARDVSMLTQLLEDVL
ncbi:MAG: HAD-IB family phosphatase [Acidobacteriota bacterium]|nr:HAD-IB family phosphatase [Acidobacteriota bacterium]